MNQEGGVPAFPEATAGTDAAVDYVNRELGGIGGHPLQLKTCAIQAEEDGQKCGTEMVNDTNVRAVLTGVLTAGNDSLYKVVVPKLPVVVGNPVANPDFLTAGIDAFTPGSPGVIQGLAVFIAKVLSTPEKPVKTVAVVYGDNEGAKAAVNVLFNPALNKLGITDIKAVPVSDTATAPDLQAALQAAGAQDADVVVPLVIAPLCIATYDALKALGISPTVVTTGLCYGTSMTQHLKDVGDSGDVPNGWYFGGYGYSYFMPDEASGMSTYLAKVRQYGGQDVEYTGFAGPQFGNVLTTRQVPERHRARQRDQRRHQGADVRLHRTDDDDGRDDDLRQGLADLPRVVRRGDGHPAVRQRHVGVRRRRAERQAHQPRSGAGRRVPRPA